MTDEQLESRLAWRIAWRVLGPQLVGLLLGLVALSFSVGRYTHRIEELEGAVRELRSMVSALHPPR